MSFFAKQTKLTDAKIALFAGKLCGILDKLGYAIKLIDHRDGWRDNIIFRFNPAVEISAMDQERIAYKFNSRKIYVKQSRGKLEIKFPRIVVFMVNAIK